MAGSLLRGVIMGERVKVWDDDAMVELAKRLSAGCGEVTGQTGSSPLKEETSECPEEEND